MRHLVKKLATTNRLAPALLARAPSFKIAAGALADSLQEILLSNGETVHLRLPSHTHLNPGDILLDSIGMMVRIDAASQAVLAVTHSQPQALVTLALAAHKQGRALGWEGSHLLLALDNALAHYLHHAGFDISHRQGTLNLPLAGLPEPEHACGHAAHEHTAHEHTEQTDTHAHSHGHTHAAHVHGPDCKH